MNTFRITIRLNKQEAQNFETIKKEHANLTNSKFIKSMLFKEIKPFLAEYEREILSNYIYELNAIGRNLNQLLKYKAFNDCEVIIKDIADLVNEAKKVL